MAKSIMIQGCGSSVGKSLIVAGLCRAFQRRGLKVRPFKPQNMSNNAAVTAEGGEIGRAQALQARACRVPPHCDMNPVLLKPESETGAQVILQGKHMTTVKAREYADLKPSLLTKVIESFGRLKDKADLVIVEGAGSPAETNLRAGDIANMGFATAAKVPVILVGDIDRGGVIAQLVGSHTILPADDRDLICGFMVNKFRGDPSLFDDALIDIVTRTNWHNLGVLPWFADAAKLPAEDALDLARSGGNGGFKIAVPHLSRIANFDDLDPLKLTPGVSVHMVQAGQALPGDADLVLIPGSKSTIADLAYFRTQGWDIDLLAHVRRGGHVLGICGGYQMLGKTIADPDGIEGRAGEHTGLGLLDVHTVMRPEKHVTESSGIDLDSGNPITGYEIHIGDTSGPDCEAPWLQLDQRQAGAQSSDGRIKGCYLHGIFVEDAFRTTYLRSLGASAGDFDFDAEIDQTLDALAEHIEHHSDIELIWAMAR